MAFAAVEVSRAILGGGDVEAAVEEIKTRNLSLQAELAALIAQEGGTHRISNPGTLARAARIPVWFTAGAAPVWRPCSRRRPAAA